MANGHDSFGRVVEVSGGIAVVGAWGAGTGGFRAGAAYIFQRNEGGADNWGEVKKLTASDVQAGDFFGQSVAVSGDTAVVGAEGKDAVGSDAGAAYVFQEPAPPPPVGGVSLDSDLRPLPLETSQSSSSPWAVVVGIVGAACLVALGGAAWYARRRRGEQRAFS